MTKQIRENIEIFACPACKGDLEFSDEKINCTQCRKCFSAENNIPLMFCPNQWEKSQEDVTETIKSFYEETPFPNYEDLENVGDLIQKAQKGVFAHLLNEQTPFNIKVLEVGCGTGQLSNFLSTSQRFVFGTDMCLNSLKLGQNFKEKNGMTRAGFYQMNLFKPIFKEQSFSLVVCNGVLHHTSDPFGGFKSISKLVKKGGYIIVGLYNRYGRAITHIRRGIFTISGDRFKFLDPRLKDKSVGSLRKLTWFLDQYKNPHESSHTMGEVLKWFEETGFDFVNSLPKMKALGVFSSEEKLFEPSLRGNKLDRFIAQARLSFTGGREGGFYIMIGRKRF